MSFIAQRRMRLQLPEDQVEKIAQLKAHYAEMGGDFIPAHVIIKWSINELHNKVFKKEDRPLPQDWEQYT